MSVKVNDTDIDISDILSAPIEKSEKKTTPSKTVKKTTLPKRQAKEIQEKQEAGEKQKLIMIIQKYQSNQRFKDFVCKDLKITYTQSQLDKKSVVQLNDILHRIRVHLDNKNLDKFYNNLAKSGSSLFETVVSPMYDIEGFSDNLCSNDEFWNIYARFKIENTFPTIPPSVQLMWVITQTMVITHELNRRKPPPKKELQPPVLSKELEEDLGINDEDKEDDKKPTYSAGQKL